MNGPYEKTYHPAADLYTFYSCTGNKEVKPAFGPGEFKKWAHVPPMGWNSWDCYGPTVMENEVKANADYMAAWLKDFGWEYVVVDIRWFVENTQRGGYNQKILCIYWMNMADIFQL